ncbi:MAG: hypothetical protein M1825_005713 [Sarcosagium campestre]|nr:MAG: hypothetical protein M1825_005713 [Sarcosagium campestre]
MAPSSTVVVKIKVQLKLSISRLRMVQQKDIAIAKQQRRAMAQLLEQGREESARIRVENIILSDITTELLEVIELYCELLLARIGLLEAKECDPGLEEAVKSIIYAAPRTEIKELQQARALLMEKFGKEFALEAVENRDGKVAERVLKKLRIEPPPQELVTEYLREIARTYGIDWPKRPRSQERSVSDGGEVGDDDDQPSGGQAIKSVEEPLATDALSKATPPRDLGQRSPVSVAPPSPSTDNLNPKIKAPLQLKPSPKTAGANRASSTTEPKSLGTSDGAGGAKKTGSAPSGIGGKIPDVDELAARFAALKK